MSSIKKFFYRMYQKTLKFFSIFLYFREPFILNEPGDLYNIKYFVKKSNDCEWA